MSILGRAARAVLPRPVYERLLAWRGLYAYRERLGLIRPPWIAYGLSRAAHTAQRYGYSSISVAEFGVANGRGLRQIVRISRMVTKATGVKISVFGFDSGEGLPLPVDYRDHPEIFGAGDFPMQDPEQLVAQLRGQATIVFGSIDQIEGLDALVESTGPLGFASIDLDYYTSARPALELIVGAQVGSLLPIVPMYFDDVWARWEYNRWCGELLAIDECNSEHAMRKIDVDRYAPYWHRQPRVWHRGLYALHVLDHPRRTPRTERDTSVIGTGIPQRQA